MPAFWRPEVSRVVVLYGSVDDVAARLKGCRLETVRERGVGTHVIARKGIGRLQLLVKPHRGHGDSRLLLGLPPELGDFKLMIENLSKLSDLAAGKLVTRSHGNERLGVVLQALDGALAGASQREIAVELFGAARVARDWGPDGGHLRDVVRRAIRRGRYLLNGGYLDLLR